MTKTEEKSQIIEWVDFVLFEREIGDVVDSIS